VGPFSFGNRAFNGYVIDLCVIVSLLPFIVEVGVGVSSDGEDCAIGGIGDLWNWRRVCYLWS
jgi:hypothetical protein